MAILYLWQNENTIVIGHNQDYKAECRFKEFTDDGGKIARRKSGGGAVYHDLGNLNYSIISLEEDLPFTDYKQIIVGALMKIGVPAEYNGRNDIILCSRKISGNAFYCRSPVICQHGTILVNTDISRMSYYLTPGEEKLKRNAVKSVSSRVINLSEVFPDITVEIVRKTFIEHTLAEPLKAEMLFNNEFSALEKKFASKDWIQGGIE